MFPAGRTAWQAGSRGRAGARHPWRMLSGPAGTAELRELDATRVWHPYAPMPGTTPPLVVQSAAGVRLRLAEPAEGRRELVDGMSSWWAAIHGYRHPVLDEAARAQLAEMSHVMFGGLTHGPAVRLCDRLAQLTPAGLDHVFLCDSGSVSVEVAIKMCLQYWLSAGRQPSAGCSPGAAGTTATRSLRCRSAIRTAACTAPGTGAAAAGVRGPAARPFAAGVDPGYAAHLSGLIEAHAGELAAVIVEPVAQGAGGMRFHDPGYLSVLRKACSDNDVLLIFDEIATGFGRTGAMFAAGSRRGRPGRDVRGEGAGRRVPVARRDFVHPGGGRGDIGRRAAGARARPHVHGQPAGLRDRERIDRRAARRLPGGWQAEVARIEAACGPGWNRSPGCPGSPMCGCSARSASCSSIMRWIWQRHAGRRCGRASGCGRSAT